MSQEVILEIHERCHNESLYRPEIVHFFGENKKFWGKMRDDLTKDGVSLRMATVYNKRKILVKTYLRCEKMGPNHNLPLLTTKRSRGYRLFQILCYSFDNVKNLLQ